MTDYKKIVEERKRKRFLLRKQRRESFNAFKSMALDGGSERAKRGWETRRIKAAVKGKDNE